MKKNSIHVWIAAGYEQFAAEGLEGIQVERLARITALNKSGYYHYFGDRDSFLEFLMKHHLSIAEQMANEIHLVRQIDPDFIAILLKYTETVMVHMQLVRNRDHKLLYETFRRVNGIIDPKILPAWANFINSPLDHSFTAKYFEQVRDMFYSRITFERMNYAYVRNLLYDAKQIVTGCIDSVPQEPLHIENFVASGEFSLKTAT